MRPLVVFKANVRNVLIFMKVIFFIAFDLIIVCFLKLFRKNIDSKSVIGKYKYGFIFTSDIGDALIFSVFLKVFLRKNNFTCLVITSSINAEILRGYFSEIDIIVIDYYKYKSNLIYRFRKIKDIISIALDFCVVPMRSREYALTDSIANVIRKNKVITFISDDSNRSKYEVYLEKLIYDEWLGGYSIKSHELNTYKLLLDRLGIDFEKELSKEVPFRETSYPIEKYLPSDIPQTYVVMNIGASQIYKRWPVAKYIALSKILYDELGLISLFVGGSSEKSLMGLFDSYPFIIDYILKTDNLDVLRSIILNAKFVVSNDSFVGHYSIILGVPTVSVAGGGHFGRFLPYPTVSFPMYSNSYTVYNKLSCFNCAWLCSKQLPGKINDSFPCINEISVEEVFASISILSEQQKY